MNNNYIINYKILNLITSISIKIGEIKANYLEHQSNSFLKENRINSIFNTLLLDGNKLPFKKVEGILNNKIIVGVEKEVKEVVNASNIYEKISKIKFSTDKSFLTIHSGLTAGTLVNSEKYRNQDKTITTKMNELFEYLKNSDDLTFIKSCVVHYQIQTIKPFEDGNGRMARLWQRLVLNAEYPVFEFLSFENVIANSQKEYKALLSKKDLTLFIEYQLGVIDTSLQQLLNYNTRILRDTDRIDYFSTICKTEFSRKDYMNIFKDLSSASASRDLRKGVEIGKFSVIGDKNKAKYKVTKYNYLKLS